MNARTQVCGLVLCLWISGCGKGATDPRQDISFRASRDQVASAKSPAPMSLMVSAGFAEAPADASATAKQGVATIARKIVYRADVDLVCDDFAAVAERLESMVTASGGFIADAQSFGSSGQPRRGEWKLRVPANRFDGLLAEIKKLAEIRTARTTSDDVSEVYYDVEARIRNKQQEETRLLRLLDDRTAKLDEVLSVEREISRVRGEVEQLQARQRVLTDLIDLATLTVRLEEVHGYRSETAASFTLRLTRGVRQSFDSLVSAIEATIIALAVALPWFVVLGLPLSFVWLVVRRRLPRSRSAIN